MKNNVKFLNKPQKRKKIIYLGQLVKNINEDKLVIEF